MLKVLVKIDFKENIQNKLELLIYSNQNRFWRKVISAFPVQLMLTYFFKPFGEPYFAFLLDFHLLHYASQL